MGEARFLVLDDEPLVRRSLSKLLGPLGQVVPAGSASEGSALVADGTWWSALFLDARLPDGSGLDVLAKAREVHPRTPAMVLTGAIQPELVNAAHDLRAHCVAKPVESARIKRFAHEAISVAARLEPVVLGWVTRYGLSEAEADVLRRAALGESKPVIASARACSDQTIKRHIVNLLRRTGDPSLHAAVDRLLREMTLT